VGEFENSIISNQGNQVHSNVFKESLVGFLSSFAKKKNPIFFFAMSNLDWFEQQLFQLIKKTKNMSPIFSIVAM